MIKSIWTKIKRENGKIFTRRISILNYTKFYNNIWWLIIIIGIVLFGMTVPRDPDFGWHLRYGEYTLINHSIPPPDFRILEKADLDYVDHEWLSNVFTYWLYEKKSFLGLTFANIIVVLLTFLPPLLVLPGNVLLKLVLTTVSLLLVFPVYATGFRPQLLTLLFFNITWLTLLTQAKKTKTLFLLMPLLFLFWANLHGGYLVGLALVWLYAIWKLIKGKERSLIYLVIALLSLFASLLQPARAYTVGSPLQTITRTVLPISFVERQDEVIYLSRQTINEWQLKYLYTLDGKMYFSALVVALVFILFVSNQIPFGLRLMAVSFIYLSTLSRRQAPFLPLVSLPLILIEHKTIEKTFVRLRNLLLRFNKKLAYATLLLFLIGITIASSWLVYRFGTMQISRLKNARNFSVYVKHLGLPYPALGVIREHKLKGQMFNFYNWGGFLMWQLPEYQTFIDGRKPESEFYRDYLKIMQATKEWEKLVDYYSIDWFLIPPNNSLDKALRKNMQWKILFEDDISVIHVKEI